MLFIYCVFLATFSSILTGCLLYWFGIFNTEKAEDILLLPPMSFRKTAFFFSSLFFISIYFNEYEIGSIFWGIASMFVTLMVTSTMYHFPEDYQEAEAK